MANHDQTLFDVDRLEIDWLPQGQRWAIPVPASGLLAGLVVGLVTGLVVGLVAGLVVGLVAGLVVGLVGGLVVGVVAAALFFRLLGDQAHSSSLSR